MNTQAGLGKGAAVIFWSNTKSNINMAKPPIFNREVGKMSGSLIAYRLFIRMKMRNNIVEEEVQWVLSYV